MSFHNAQLATPIGDHVFDHLPWDVQQMIDGCPPGIQDAIGHLPPSLMDVAVQQAAYIDRRAGAELISQHVFKVSWRTLEGWRVPWRKINGRAKTPPIILLAVAYSKRAGAPVCMGGRHTASEPQAA
jgi:hypothetical protein